MENKKTAKRILIIILSVLVIGLSFMGGFLAHYLSMSKEQRLIAEILSNIDSHSVYGDDELPSPDDVAKVITGVMLSDDKYSAYYSKSEYEKVLAEAQGKYLGVGLSFLNDSTDCKIYDVTVNSPAYLAEIMAGDIIVSGEYDGEDNVSFSNVSELFSFLKQDKNKLSLYITREGQFENKKFVLTKSEYVSSYVSYVDDSETLFFISDTESKNLLGKSVSLPKDTAYVKLTQFNGGAGAQFKGAMEKLKAKNKTRLILDLRSNGGGYMTVLQEVASYLIYNGGKSKNLIAYAEGKNYKESFYTQENNFNTAIKDVYILADENTASASECLIGAMLYYGDSTDINHLFVEYNGERKDYSTFGKGIMQSTFTLKNGGALKLTTAKIYQPDKKTCIHGLGIKPIAENCAKKGNALATLLDTQLEK